MDVYETFGFIRKETISTEPHEVCLMHPTPRRVVTLLNAPLTPAPRAALMRSDVELINLVALHKDTELPFLWAYVDSSDPTSTIVKAPMHCFYGDRGCISNPRMRVDPNMLANAPILLSSMDRIGVVGFECVTRP